MQDRPTALQSFLDGIDLAVRSADPADEASAASMRGMVAALATPGAPGMTGPHRLPVCSAHLGAALSAAERAGGIPARIAQDFARIEPMLSWRRRPSGPLASQGFDDAHANATIVGPGGIERRDDAWVGVSLMAPGARYPDHNHPPEEVYVVLSPGEWRRGDGDWFEPGIGGVLFNEANVRHAMRAGTAPLLAIWCLPLA